MFRLLEWFFYDVLRLKHSADKPCPHMKGRLSDLSDDTAKGVSRWYTEQHVAGCPGCSARLTGLRLLRSRLMGLDKSTENRAGDVYIKLALSPEQWQAVTQSWERSDERRAATLSDNREKGKH